MTKESGPPQPYHYWEVENHAGEQLSIRGRIVLIVELRVTPADLNIAAVCTM